MSNDSNEHVSFFKKFFLKGFKKKEPASAHELEDVIHEASENEIIDETTEEMLKGIFDINRLRIKDVMIPSSDIVTINLSSSVLEAAKIVFSSGHSRYPVISEDKDHIAGILLAKDLIPYVSGLKDPKTKLSDIIRPTVIVPESKRVNSMLKDFQQKRFHIAMVVDEFGSIAGLVTIEDILELIVGDIDDEYDTNPTSIPIKKNLDNSYSVQALTQLDEFNDYFKANLKKIADVDTIGGLILHILGRFPLVGESLEIDDFSFKITKATANQIIQLELLDKRDYKEKS